VLSPSALASNGAPEARVQGLRHGLLPARAPEAHVQGLRHGPLRARAPEGAVQGLLNAAAASTGAGGGAVQGLLNAAAASTRRRRGRCRAAERSCCEHPAPVRGGGGA
jgi:hypothetical protein